MQIRRFEAKDMTTALRLIKNELGPEAVILSARSLRQENRILGLVKSVGVEVTAALDAHHHPLTLIRYHIPARRTATAATIQSV
jgi:flagellar biosynthesis GTPase FlhF